ncbi:MAG: histidinol dehydrogenase [Rhodospirillales bacterium]|jgi:histidinol dehydrogenase|nr:histidinol dehydrogenase [Rhodospirillaceae bacterium]MDP6429501.1 histidinol dehydrogenase [Rhodospirillales bacterium]MDP6645544.1 histidinol dehydrogenase [Rhodospirillales bacterium]MDP6840868.1 histidinol dehydrogenase [Rhodospirillales bacterium]
MPARIDLGDPGFEQEFERFLGAKRETAGDVAGAVAAIIDQVRERGDDALIELTRRFDGFELDAENLRLGEGEIKKARHDCSNDEIQALELAAERISAFHARQSPEDLEYRDEAGLRLGHRWRAIKSVGMYVPGGTAAYPSSVLMNALPAKVAGVSRLVMTAPAPGGAFNPLVLTAAEIAGVDEIYRVGGAQAIAAMAMGTESIQPVDKIVGPGNAYVAEAKRQLFGIVGIDMIAGPSEILVVADGDNDPGWIAADLLSQAEHDSSAQAILITDDAGFADQVLERIQAMLESLPRKAIASESWDRFGAVILVGALSDAAPIIDAIAPEHLELAMDGADELFAEIEHAGSVFLGRYAPEALGDYLAGPNHVLPTGRSARFSSGLGVLDFMKRTSFIGAGKAPVEKIGAAAVTLARAEGLHAHALSVSLRLGQTDPD